MHAKKNFNLLILLFPNYSCQVTTKFIEVLPSCIYLVNTLEFTMTQRDLIKSWFQSCFKRVSALLKKVGEYSFKKSTLNSEIFYINNLHVIFLKMQEVGEVGRGYSAITEVVMIDEAYKSAIDKLSQVILERYVGYVLKFVDANENINLSPLPDQIRAKLLEINAKFKEEWNKSLTNLNISLKAIFPNQKTLADVQQRLFNSFLNYYHRLHKIVDKISDPNLTPQPSLHQMVIEIKRLKFGATN